MGAFVKLTLGNLLQPAETYLLQGAYFVGLMVLLAVHGASNSGILPNHQNVLRNSQNNEPDNSIATGSVNTHASAKFRTVDHWMPEWLAAIVPAMPEESTCVVLTGSPKPSAAPMVAIAVISATAPCA